MRRAAPSLVEARTQATNGDQEPQVDDDTAQATGDADWADADAFLAATDRAEEEVPDYRGILLPEGAQIVVALTSVEVANIGAATKWLAMFRLVDDPGKVILRSYNPPRGPLLSRNHALYGDWQSVVGRPLRALPKRFTAKGVIRAFAADCHLRASTRVVNRQMNRSTKRWETTPLTSHYSVIEKFIGVEGGTPRANQRRRSRGKF